MTDRIVVVGHSATTCLGRDMDATWEGLLAGRSGIKRHAQLAPESYLVDLGGMVEDFGPGSAGEDPAVSRLAARSIHLAMATARAAWADAGLDRLSGQFDPDRAAIVVGSAFGGLDLLEAEQVKSSKRKNLAASPYLVPGLLINQAAGQVAQHLGLYGPSMAPANACATGGHAIALGAMFLRSGEADIAVCGGAESAFTPMIVNGFATMKALCGRRAGDRSIEDPSQASRPFSEDRAGFVMAEGAGMVVLATEAKARELGLPVQAILAGWALNTDGYHMAMPNGERITRCLAVAVERSGLAPDRIDYYNAHGTSTSVNDRVETQAVKDVFGDHARRMAISSIKGALGHGLGAASAIEAAACVRALRDQIIPPTINYRADPELDLDYVPDQARPAKLEAVLSASFGFGGTNNALILARGDR
ncbi:beta-ketoacyl-[acyl-carrier-protein] synthase family protein [Tundrisphaera sp. TA3]|uniref:beta-ketoacyl-[acyl-carrier-protein] synthase family protein n=1 Tax=Tundrisphaera sp. TA3 TaxID=3435775 RepID=UPI003EBBFED3